MYKMREDGQIVYAHNGIWSKQSRLLPNIAAKRQLKRRRYLHCLPLLCVVILAAILANWFVLLLGIPAFVWSLRKDQALLNVYPIVDDRVTYREFLMEGVRHLQAPESRTWARVFGAFSPFLSLLSSCAFLVVFYRHEEYYSQMRFYDLVHIVFVLLAMVSAILLFVLGRKSQLPRFVVYIFDALLMISMLSTSVLVLQAMLLLKN